LSILRRKRRWHGVRGIWRGGFWKGSRGEGGKYVREVTGFPVKGWRRLLLVLLSRRFRVIGAMEAILAVAMSGELHQKGLIRQLTRQLERVVILMKNRKYRH